jgi:hypothetical protein
MDERRENLLNLLTLLIVLCLGLTFTTALSLAITYRLVNVIESYDQKTQNTK